MANLPRSSLLLEPKLGNSQAKKASLETGGERIRQQNVFRQPEEQFVLELTAVPRQVDPGPHLRWEDERPSAPTCPLVCCHNPPPAPRLNSRQTSQLREQLDVPHEVHTGVSTYQK